MLGIFVTLLIHAIFSLIILLLITFKAKNNTNAVKRSINSDQYTSDQNVDSNGNL